jgi:hypothetical protein
LRHTTDAVCHRCGAKLAVTEISVDSLTNDSDTPWVARLCEDCFPDPTLLETPGDQRENLRGVYDAAVDLLRQRGLLPPAAASG